jgi:hypothetical protein
MLISSRRKKPSFGAGKKSQVSILFSLLEAPRQVGLRRLAPRLQKSLRYGAFRSCSLNKHKGSRHEFRRAGGPSLKSPPRRPRKRPQDLSLSQDEIHQDRGSRKRLCQRRERGRCGSCRGALESREAELVLVGMSYKIAEGDWASGEIPRRCGSSHTSVAPDEAFDDMALYVRHTKGLVVLTG